MQPLLLATDLDRTVIPNGAQPESPASRPLFAKLAASPDVTLAYVSGRGRPLLQQAIEEYDLPLPDYAVGDVGTTIYQVGPGRLWRGLPAWERTISPDWRGFEWNDIKRLFSDFPRVRLQEDNPAFQSKFKVSYYTDPNINKGDLVSRLQERAASHKLKLSIIFSIDESRNLGLLDILPRSATKLHALRFLRRRLRQAEDRTLFCGDSGNDIPVLTSGLKAVMVKNTRPPVQDEVNKIARQKNITDKVYTARGGFLNLNGNYAAGVLEGAAHFFPETAQLLV